jgi:hypothetical protein
LAVPDSTQWTDVDVDVSSLVNQEVGSVRPNAVLLYINVPRGSKALDVDDVRLTEWRTCRRFPAACGSPPTVCAGRPVRP